MRYQLLVTVCLGAVLGAHAALTQRPLCVVPKAVLGADGAPNWTQAAALGPLLRSDGLGMPEAGTTARICRTPERLLLRVECQEPQIQALRASVTQRDGMVWGDDCIEVFLRVTGRPSYAHFVVNPLGTGYDEHGRDASWNVPWDCSAGRGEASWWCEIGIPFTSLGGAPSEGSEWELNLCRSRRPEPELSTWSATGSGFHVPDRFGTIRFADQPWPTGVGWSWPARRDVRVELAWRPDGAGVGLLCTVNGADAGRPVRLEREGIVPLWLEARSGQTPVYRTCYVATITPMGGALQAARGAVGRLTDGALAAPLTARLDAIEALREQAGPNLAADLAAQARDIEVQATRLKLVTDLREKGAPADAIAYGVVSSLEKVLKHLPFRGQAGGTVVLDAARGEMDAAQVLVVAGEDPLLMVEASLSEAKGPGSAVLPVTAFRVRRVGYVHTCKPVYRVEYTGLWPDPLLEPVPFDVKTHDVEPLWLDVRVPPGTPPGLYKGSLSLTARNSRPTAVPVDVRVRGFTIPARPSLSTAFGLSPQWRVPQDRDAYLRNVFEHRVSPYDVTGAPKLVTPPAMDWQGARRLRLTLAAAVPGDVRAVVVRADDGKAVHLGPAPMRAGAASEVAFDLPPGLQAVRSWRVTVMGPGSARLSAVLETAAGSRNLVADALAGLDLGADGWLRQWLTWEGTAWDQPDRPAVWDWTAFDAAFEKALALGLTAHRAALQSPLGPWAAEYQRHLGEKGWLPLFYTYLYDEPEPAHFALVNERLGAVKQAAPGLANLMTARSFPPELPFVDIWCPEAYSYDPAASKAEQAKGKTVWWYVAFSTRHPYPNVWIDYPALDCRVWPWMTWKHDIDGMLYWSATHWALNNPWSTGETFHDSNGDGSLLYPGVDGRPVDSLRWECLRDGLEDYEVFCLLEAGARELAGAAGQADLVAQARALCAIDDAVVRSYKDYNPDPRALLAARRAMSETLEAVVQALGHEPVITDRPRRRRGAVAPTLPAASPAATAAAPPPQWDLPAAAPEPGLVLSYDFDQKLPFACDRSGRGNHGLVTAAEFADGSRGQGLWLRNHGAVVLPSGAELLGDRAAEGSVTLWARPDFDPGALPSGLYEGYAVLFYAMQTDGNGLPDGYDEIGIYMHGPNLQARAGGRNCLFATLPNPLRRGAWTHLAITWQAARRTLFVDGNAVVVREDAFDPPALDAFRTTLAAHAPNLRWGFQGSLDEVRVYTRALTSAEVSRLAAR